jgi:mRNA interferase RelE/StbE
MYRIVLSRRATKELDALMDDVAARILARLEGLRTNPRPTDVKKLRGRDGWRIRVGDYRVIYSINDKDLLILVVRVGHRSDIYR